jgi:ubiquitin C-terminal hydrolase
MNGVERDLFKQIAIFLVLITSQLTMFPAIPNKKLVNAGNSCYFDSAIQILSRIDEFNNVLKTVVVNPGKELNESNIQAYIPFLYLKLIEKIKKGGSDLNPADKFYGNITWKMFYNETAKKIFGESGSQQDANSFTIDFIKQIDSGETASLNTFDFNIILEQKCKICNDIKYRKFQKNLRLHFNMNLNKNFNENLNIPEIKIQCEKCNIKTTHGKMTLFCKLPKIFYIDCVEKPQSKVALVETLIFSKDWIAPDNYLTEKTKEIRGMQSIQYDLFAIIVHSGGSSYVTPGGHYWANIKYEDGNWYKHDDLGVTTKRTLKDIISNDSEDEKLSYNAPTSIFYRLRENRIELLSENLLRLKNSIAMLKLKLQSLNSKLDSLKDKLKSSLGADT